MRTQRVLSTVLLLLLPCLLPAPSARSQEKKIGKKDLPPAVLAAFEKAYPHAKVRGTSTEVEKGTTFFEIESLDGTQARDILYLADGTIAEIEEVVAASELPAPVKTAVGEEFAKAKIAKAERTTKGTEISFEVHVSLGSKRGSIVVDPSGKVIDKHPLKAEKKKTANEEAGVEEDD
jgi:hypothetical protein